VSEMTHEDALLLADALLGQELKETEARCAVLAQFIDQCDRARAHTAAWSDALRELSALQDHRSRLIRRRSLIQEALDCALGAPPSKAPLPPPPRSPARTQHQVQVQVRRR
jgi:hypothetical protein